MTDFAALLKKAVVACLEILHRLPRFLRYRLERQAATSNPRTVGNMGNIQEIPPSVLRSWPTPNYVDPIQRTWMPAFALSWQVASTILVWGRFYLRIRHLAGPFGYDDAFMLIAWVGLAQHGNTVCTNADHIVRVHS